MHSAIAGGTGARGHEFKALAILLLISPRLHTVEARVGPIVNYRNAPVANGTRPPATARREVQHLQLTVSRVEATDDEPEHSDTRRDGVRAKRVAGIMTVGTTAKRLKVDLHWELSSTKGVIG